MVTMALLQGVLNTFVIFLSRIIATAVASSRNNNGEETRSSSLYFFSVNGVRDGIWRTCQHYCNVVLTLS